MAALYEEVKAEKQWNSYAVFDRLKGEKGVSSYRVAHDLNIPECTFTTWKKHGTTPKYLRLKAIAEYFGVSVDLFYEEAEKGNGTK